LNKLDSIYDYEKVIKGRYRNNTLMKYYQGF